MMVAAEQKLTPREAIHRMIDEFSDEELKEVITFIGYLQYKYKAQPKGSPWAKEFYDLFAPVREAVVASGMTEDEIDQLLDEELEEVRRGRKP